MVLAAALVVVSSKKILKGLDIALSCVLYVVFWIMCGLAECVWYPRQMILFLVFFTPKFLQNVEE
ncbi:MAG: hypothetical protein HDQ96_12115 [Lachnospiraceae bacterium]|nr:hypothetical protein [Lachnospiraceae bacterium]